MITPDELLRVKIFKDLPGEHLSALIPKLTEKIFPAGTAIMYRGDPGTSMYMILEGTVVVTLVNDEGIEYSIATMGAGDIFGEMALMTGEPRTANVKAQSSVHLLELRQDAFFQLVATNPAVNENLLQLLIQRRTKTAIRQQTSVSKRKGNIATLFAEHPPEIERLIGKTKWAEDTDALIDRLAANTGNILLLGERGTGKDLVARLIHSRGPEAEQPLYHLDCANPPPVQRAAASQASKSRDALHREIAQASALFGHGVNAGSFAQGLRRGYLELADSGTVILENIEALAHPVQRLLVQYIQHGTFVRKGETEQISSRVRLLATSSQPLEELQQKGRLSAELRNLLGVETLTLRPLRERKKDIPLIAEYFLREYNQKFSKQVTGFSKQATNLLVDHDWPLNVEELRQVVERAVAVATGETILESQVFLNIPTFSATGKYNLLRNPYVRKLADHPLFPTGMRFITIPMLLLLAAITLAGPSDNNPANLVVWAVGWPVLMFSIILAGRSFCGFCPFPLISEKLNRYRRSFFSPPGFIVKNGAWIGAVGFAMILLAEHSSHMFTVPRATGLLLTTILSGAIITHFLYGKRVWCKHLCPLGKMISYTTPLSFVGMESNSTVCSSQCLTHDCVKEESCPMGLHPSAIATSSDCILCLECIKRCRHQAVHINARMPWKELLGREKWDAAGAFFAVMLGALVLAVKFSAWGPVSRFLSESFTGHVVVADLAVVVAVGTLFFVLVCVASGYPRDNDWKRNFSLAGYAYLSLSFAGFFNIYFHEFVYHAHNLIPWTTAHLGLDTVIPSAWVTPNLGTLKILIPLITLFGSISSLLILEKLAAKHSVSHPVLKGHRWVLLATTLVFLIVL